MAKYGNINLHGNSDRDRSATSACKTVTARVWSVLNFPLANLACSLAMRKFGLLAKSDVCGINEKRLEEDAPRIGSLWQVVTLTLLNRNLQLAPDQSRGDVDYC